jgi:hypothetical protein
MKKKNLTPQIAKSVNCLSIQDLSVELVELSDEALSQVYGGEEREAPWQRPICIIFDPDSLKPGISPYDGDISDANALDRYLGTLSAALKI